MCRIWRKSKILPKMVRLNGMSRLWKFFLLDICWSHSWSRSRLQLQPQSKSLARGDSGSVTLLTASWVSREKQFWGFCKKEIQIFKFRFTKISPTKLICFFPFLLNFAIYRLQSSSHSKWLEKYLCDAIFYSKTWESH